MRIKGSVLKARVEFVVERGGDALERVRAHVSPELDAEIERGFLVSEWYPLAWHNELVRVIDEQLGRGDRALYRNLGRHSCEKNLTTIYRAFLVMGGLPIMLRRVATTWRVHYDQGELKLVERGKGRARLELTGVADPKPEHCLPVAGFMERAAELAGYRRCSVTLGKCRCRGDAACEFAVEWE